MNKELDVVEELELLKTRTQRAKNRSFPILFESVGKEHTAEQLHEIRRQNKWAKLKIRLVRAMNVVVLGPIFLLVLTMLPNRPFSVVAGAGVLTMYIIYFSVIFGLLYTGTRNGKQLYRIYSSSASPIDWVDMNVSSYQLLYKNKAIKSISEFSAINGGVPSKMLSTLSAYTWAFLLMFLGAHNAFQCDFIWDVADIAEVVGIGGLIFIGMFELDVENIWMIRLHYLGAFCGNGCIIGYGIQQYYVGTKFWLPITIASIGITSMITWLYIQRRSEKFEAQYQNIAVDDVHKISQDLTRYTILCVVSEAIYLFSGALCTCLWMMEYDQNCYLGCRGPYTEQCGACNEYWSSNCVYDRRA